MRITERVGSREGVVSARKLNRYPVRPALAAEYVGPDVLADLYKVFYDLLNVVILLLSIWAPIAALFGIGNQQ